MTVVQRLSAACGIAFAFTTALHAATDSRDPEAAFYRIINIPTPPGVTMEAGALCFLGPDKLATCSRFGDVWIAEGIMGEAPKPKWTLFASGLHEALGLTTKPGDTEGWLYCTQRGEITRMRDSNGDGRADIFETVADGWGISGDYHEYAFGSKFDRERNMWVVLCLTGSFTSNTKYRGWCVRVTPEGKVIPTTSGVRSPGGIGFNAEGECFYTDNQGPWNGACKLQWLKPGAFVGHPGGNKWYDHPETKDAVAAAGMKKPADPKSKSRLITEADRIPELLPPSIYFPYNKMGQSAGGVICDQTGGKFGPFAGQLFVPDQAHSTLMRVFLEKINGHYQGACFPFRKGFASGSLYSDFAADGSLFVFGTDRGWGARGGKPFALERVVWTGEVPFEIHEMRAKPDGFEFTFTQPIDPASAENPSSYRAETYTYIYQGDYGSPEVDRTQPKITGIKVAPDRKSVRVQLDALQRGHVHEFELTGLRNAAGQPLLHKLAYYTLIQVPK